MSDSLKHTSYSYSALKSVKCKILVQGLFFFSLIVFENLIKHWSKWLISVMNSYDLVFEYLITYKPWRTTGIIYYVSSL